MPRIVLTSSQSPNKQTHILLRLTDDSPPPPFLDQVPSNRIYIYIILCIYRMVSGASLESHYATAFSNDSPPLPLLDQVPSNRIVANAGLGNTNPAMLATTVRELAD